MSSRRNKASSKGSRRGTSGSRRETGSRRNASRRGTNAFDERKEEKEDKLATNIELPKSSDFETTVGAMKVFPTMYETDINDIKGTFDELLRLLKERKEECLGYAQDRVDKFKYEDEITSPIRIDENYIKNTINLCGTTIGEGNYELNRQKILITDKLCELISCEEKFEYVSGDFTKTKSVKGIKSQIGKVKLKLKESEPILNEAKASVNEVRARDLGEIRVLPKPNKLLVRTIKACALLLGTPENDLQQWSTFSKRILTPDFITTLQNFEGTNVDPQIIQILERDYLGRGNDDMKEEDKLTFESVSRVNKVAGNFVTWLEAQLKYNEMLPEVTKLKKELKELEIQLGMMDGSSTDLINAIKILEKQIPSCKEKIRKLTKKETKMEEQYKTACQQYEEEKAASA